MNAATVSEAVINQVAQEIHATACEKGFWEPPSPFLTEISTKLALIHTEVSEAQTALRDNYPGPVNPYSEMTSQQLSDFLYELADVIIRAFDCAEYFNSLPGCETDMGTIILAKMAKNADRPRKHGKRI